MTGQTISHYQILEKLGEGGMGAVYRAKDMRLGRSVALKIIKAEFTDRFEREARAIAAMNHPNLLAIHDVGEHEGRPYLVTELIDGESLRTTLRHGPLPLKRILKLGAQIADGLAAAHQAGFIHRDVKPENIMLDREDRAIILDFGLVRRSGPVSQGDATETISQAGMIAGTAPYMSPEQAGGRAVDFRSDQFSLGLVLYEMATARKPFYRDTSAETLTAILREEAEPLPESIPAPFRWLIDRCLSKEPAQRYESTRELAQQLQQFREHFSELSSVPKGAVLPRRRRRVPLAAIAATGALIGGYVTARLTAPDTIDQSRLSFIRLTHEPGIQMTPRWSPKGDSIAYSADVDGVFQVFIRKLASPSPTQLTRMREDCLLPMWSPDAASVYFTMTNALGQDSIWVAAVAGGDPALVLDDAFGAALSPDGRTLAVLKQASPDSLLSFTVWLSSPPGRAPQRYNQPPFDKLEGTPYSFALDFSPDGSTLGIFAASLGEGRFFAAPRDGGTPRLCFSRSPMPTRVPRFSWLADGRRIVAGQPSLEIVDLKSGAALQLRTGEATASQPTTSPDGGRIAYKLSLAERDYDVIEVPLDGSGIRARLDTLQDERNPSWSPNGRQFAYSTWGPPSSEIRLYDPLERTHRTITSPADFPGIAVSMFQDVAVSPDGRRITFRRMDSKGESIWIMTMTGDTPVPLWVDPQRSPQRGPAWSPDGRWIAYYGMRDGNPALLKVRIGSAEGPEFVTAATQNRPPRWSPRGDWIASGVISGIVLTSPDGQHSRRISDVPWLIFGFSNDGKRIYGLRVADPHRLIVSYIDVESGREQQVADLGPEPATVRAALFRAEFPFRGFSMAPDGKSLLTSINRESSNIWMLEGFGAGRSVSQKLLSWK